MLHHPIAVEPPSSLCFQRCSLCRETETDQLEYIIPEESSLEQHLQVSDTMFIDFVRYLLSINPKRRPTARQALKHPWLSHVYKSK
ncbi:hypothetical protein AAHE18_07G069000 [Arachis hypogaea]|uniref:Protein kinase domain-containing protein n=1 Tax=Arachis hypogaea TaxID=3818 RepID=A0A445C5E5_ARAHY|nr:hypothetical protein Ahy_A07g031861 [Arachis hypogaea]